MPDHNLGKREERIVEGDFRLNLTFDIIITRASQYFVVGNKSCSEIKLSDRNAPTGSYVIYSNGKGGVTPLTVLTVLKFCWAKNGFVFLRKSETSPIVKLHYIEDLRSFEQSLRSAGVNDDHDDGASQS